MSPRERDRPSNFWHIISMGSDLLWNIILFDIVSKFVGNMWTCFWINNARFNVYEIYFNHFCVYSCILTENYRWWCFKIIFKFHFLFFEVRNILFALICMLFWYFSKTLLFVCSFVDWMFSIFKMNATNDIGM